MSRRDCLSELRAITPVVLPSMLLCDFGNLEQEIDRLDEAGVSALHLDVMDGVFVPNFTYGLPVVAAIRRLTSVPLDVHLMMVHPENYVEKFFDAGADIITIHVEATDEPAAILQEIHSMDAAAGIALNPGTPVSALDSCLEFADVVVIMSVEAGFGGQKFDSTVLEKIQQIREMPNGQNVLIEMDGGIKASTIGACAHLGAELLVAGSAIFEQEDYSLAIQDLMSQVECVK